MCCDTWDISNIILNLIEDTKKQVEHRTTIYKTNLTREKTITIITITTYP